MSNHAELSFSQYQVQAATTAIYPKIGVSYIYPTLGLAGEAGEFANKVKKVFRDNDGILTEDKLKELSKELGDLMWYIAAICTELKLDMGWVAQDNLNILKSRKERGVIQGSGDNR